MKFGWTDIEDIALGLEDEHPGVDPLHVRFTALRDLVEKLPGFAPDPDQVVNEQILEAIQAAWIEERQDARRDANGGDDDDPPAKPHNPFR